MQDIAKLCADSLRAHADKEHGIKIGSAHAHELVAAFFGYGSKAALLADSKYPLSNLKDAATIIPPPQDQLNIRLDRLFGGSLALKAPLVFKHLVSVLACQKWAPGAIQSSFEDLAMHTAAQHLALRWGRLGINPESIRLSIDVAVDSGPDSVTLTALVFVLGSGEGAKRLKESKLSIRIPRVAANLGYGKAEVYETRYSAGAREMESEGNALGLSLGQ